MIRNDTILLHGVDLKELIKALKKIKIEKNKSYQCIDIDLKFKSEDRLQITVFED